MYYFRLDEFYSSVLVSGARAFIGKDWESLFAPAAENDRKIGDFRDLDNVDKDIKLLRQSYENLRSNDQSERWDSIEQVISKLASLASFGYRPEQIWALLNEKEGLATSHWAYPLLRVRQFDIADSYWLLFPGSEDAVVANAYYDGLVGSSNSEYNNVFCGNNDEFKIRYEVPTKLLKDITGLTYYLENRQDKMRGPNGQRIKKDTQSWYVVESSAQLKEMFPDNPFAPLVVFSRE
ncbi:MAG TPA: hypothetical protein PK957_01000 [Candidatus Dojkabacteria bacterium]|nr:hypothetical protein [Candidatus Dojkabacteria bacterium]HQF36195.1 hypothetical protein [Candidatus Dojkabacteria bacterium]